jgi:hypothetical protein
MVSQPVSDAEATSLSQVALASAPEFGALVSAGVDDAETPLRCGTAAPGPVQPATSAAIASESAAARQAFERGWTDGWTD